MRLSTEFYRHPDVLFLSRALLGKFLMTHIDSHVTGGMITETEAYRGPEDRASHAFGMRRTKRNEVMYRPGGISYVFINYGIHHLFNVVTNEEDIPHAILIRGILATDGIDAMLIRRGKTKIVSNFSNGPGTLTQALGIKIAHNGLDLNGPSIWIEDRGIKPPSDAISTGPRVGIDYAGEDALLPWRFWLADPNNLL